MIAVVYESVLLAKDEGYVTVRECMFECVYLHVCFVNLCGRIGVSLYIRVYVDVSVSMYVYT